jgi:hypothetical protein
VPRRICRGIIAQDVFLFTANLKIHQGRNEGVSKRETAFLRLAKQILIERKVLSQSSLEDFAEEFLFLRGKLFPQRRQVEHVDGFVAFGIDQGDLDIASEAG